MASGFPVCSDTANLRTQQAWPHASPTLASTSAAQNACSQHHYLLAVVSSWAWFQLKRPTFSVAILSEASFPRPHASSCSVISLALNHCELSSVLFIACLPSQHVKSSGRETLSFFHLCRCCLLYVDGNKYLWGEWMNELMGERNCFVHSLPSLLPHLLPLPTVDWSCSLRSPIT